MVTRLLIAAVLAALAGATIGLAQTISAQRVGLDVGDGTCRQGDLYTNGSALTMRIGVMLAPGEGIILVDGGHLWTHEE